MINLDDLQQYAEIDQQNMLGFIEDLPQQLKRAWAEGIASPSVNVLPKPERVLIAGMGGSAIGADLAAAYLERIVPVPIIVQRDYHLPAWAENPQTLVIASSHSGNTEETISVYHQAVQKNCSTVVISRGGRLSLMANEPERIWWKFEHAGQPRSAVGWTFGYLIALFHQLGYLPDVGGEVESAYQIMLEQEASINPTVPLVKNPAKRQAGQLLERWVCVSGSGYMAPVARRWKGQINELAKAWAQFEFLPEMDHNTLAGTVFPASMIDKLTVLFLSGSLDHPRNSLRIDFTKQELMIQGIGTDVYEAKGETVMEQMWSAIQFGDYMAYYLSMLYGIDPTPITAMENLKATLGRLI